MIEFVLGNEVVRLDDVDPNTTVLDWLRANGRTGTKEGCASGDCGACTVAVVDRGEEESDLDVRAVNSCISLVGSLDGRAVVTVEDLAGTEGDRDLHPVQQAMVDEHGSQCGFCTPGFVMSMFAWTQDAPTTDRHDIDTALSGNLCRCTGYRPIVAAARRVAEGHVEPLATHDDGLRRRLDDLAASRRAHGMAALEDPDGTTWHAPRDLDEAVAVLADHPDAVLVAGGTDLVLEITQDDRHFDHLVDVTRIAELHAVETDGEVVTIGAAVPLEDAQHTLTDLAPATTTLWQRYGSVPIRNTATIGGNLGTASPIGDTPPVLLALDASVVVAGSDGVRSVPIDDFFLDYRKTARADDEVIVAVEVPRPGPGDHLSVSKVSKRLDDDISAVCAVVNLTLDDDGTVTAARLGFGGMAAVPKRASGAEQALADRPLDDESVAAAVAALADDFTPIDDMRASAAYRAQVAGNLLRRAHLEFTAGNGDAARPVRVEQVRHEEAVP